MDVKAQIARIRLWALGTPAVADSLRRYRLRRWALRLLNWWFRP